MFYSSSSGSQWEVFMAFVIIGQDDKYELSSVYILELSFNRKEGNRACYFFSANYKASL